MTMTSIQTNSVTELVIVDGALPDVDVLVQGVHDRAAVFVLDPSTDGLAQMAAIAARYTGLAAIHVVSHGSAGSLQLGTTQLDAGSLQSHHTSLASLGASLSGEGDLLFYGCNVAQGPVGRTFIDAVALATGADVAASTDLTGASFLGGNWQLEAGTGSIEAGSLAIVRYAQTLESPDVLASTSTTATLPLSGSVSGTVGSSGDQDWYRVTLTGGVSYRIEQEKLNGSTNGLADTYLRLFNAAGAQIADNDDIAGAANRNSRVLYTPASTGVVYVSAGAFGNNLGDYSVRVLQVNTLASSGNDTLTGTANNDFLDGGDGDDLLNRGAGDDVLSGGGGRDTLAGGDGDDTLDGGIAADSMNGGDGNDTYYVDDVGDVAAESWNDSIGGVDTVYSTATSHTLGFGIEHLVLTGFLNANGVGNANANALTGNSADNALSGGAGSDTLAGGNGSDTLDGGDGIDRASYAQSTSPVTVSLAVTGTQNTGGSGSHRLLNIEELEGGSADDFLGGDGQANLLLGLAGNDTLDGGGGNDTLDGGSGQDTATYASAPGAVRVSLAIAGPQDTGAAGLDTLVSIEELQGGAFDDTLTGGSGSDTLRGGAGNDTLVGGPGNDSLDGGDGTQDRVSYANASVGLTVGLGGNWNLGALGTDIFVNIEQLEGSNFDDFLVGTDADDWYLGGLGNDTLFGGLGNDTLDGGSGTQDQAIYDNATSGVTVSLGLAGAQFTGNAGFDTLLRIEYLTGGAFDDLLIGDDGDNRLEGLGGNDTLEGGLGNDTLDGGAGFDIASFASAFGVYVSLDDPNPHFTGAGIDTFISIEGLEGSQYDDELRGNSGNNRLSGLGGDDTLGGGGGFDTLLGGFGNDVLDGTGFGASTLVGGDGNDIYFVDSTDDFVDESGSNGYDIVRTFASISLTDGIEEVNYFGADGGGITGNNQDNLMTRFF